MSCDTKGERALRRSSTRTGRPLASSSSISCWFSPGTSWTRKGVSATSGLPDASTTGLPSLSARARRTLPLRYVPPSSRSMTRVSSPTSASSASARWKSSSVSSSVDDTGLRSILNSIRKVTPTNPISSQDLKGLGVFFSMLELYQNRS